MAALLHMPAPDQTPEPTACTNIVSTPPVNSVTVDVSQATGFYRISTE